MITFKSEYVDNLRTSAEHVQSHSKLITDAPLDNHGKGESFSPTDLVATGLGSCMATVMGIHGKKMGILMDGLQWETQKTMKADPRKIERIKIRFSWPNPQGDNLQREKLKQVALKCPVALSIHPEIHQDIEFDF